MKKNFHIKKNIEFQNRSDTGNSFANREFVIYYKEKSNEFKFRVGISVGKKIGNAVTRNKIKRYIREVFRELENDLIENIDLIIIARNPTKRMNLNQFKRSILHLLHKQHLLK